MRVAVCFPSCNAARAFTSTQRWKAQGYEVYIAAEQGFVEPAGAVVLLAAGYSGYWAECNKLARRAAVDGCEVFVCIGDDMDPDPSKTAPEIGSEYLARFPDGYGIMQPIGEMEPGVNKICGSPWFGLGWLKRAYDGWGPLWPEYKQFFGDQELYIKARLENVIEQRADLHQHHHHWMFKGGPAKTDYQKANDRYWESDKALFKARMAKQFPSYVVKP